MAVEIETARRKFTREEYHRMGEVGILKPSDRVELIRGEIVEIRRGGDSGILDRRLRCGERGDLSRA